MFDYDFFYLILKALGISVLVTICMVLYRTLGRPTKPFVTHANPYFRFVANAVSSISIVVPLLLQISVYKAFVIALLVNLLLQKIADDYVS